MTRAAFLFVPQFNKLVTRQAFVYCKTVPPRLWSFRNLDSRDRKAPRNQRERSRRHLRCRVEFQPDFKRRERDSGEKDDVRSDRSPEWRGVAEERRDTSYPRFRRYLRVSAARSNGCRTAGFTARGQHM